MSADIRKLLRSIEGAHDLLCIRFGPAPIMEPIETRGYTNRQLAGLLAVSAATLLTAGPGPIGSLILAAIVTTVGAVASLVAWWRT